MDKETQDTLDTKDTEIEKEFSFEEIDRNIKEALKQLKEFRKEFLPRLKEGDYVDVLDKVKIWRAAVVVQRSQTEIEAKFLGWTAKWNERKKINSGHVFPYRSQISGYSGPKKRKISDSTLINKLYTELLNVSVLLPKIKVYFQSF